MVVRIEKTVELVASGLFGGALGFAANVFLSPVLPGAKLQLLLVAATAIAGLLLSSVVMRAMNVQTTFRSPVFELSELEQFDPDELLASAGDCPPPAPVLDTDEQIACPAALAPEPLVLDDVLAKIGPDSRVVRLFDRKAMPTPGQLQSRIADHLGEKRSSSTQDASDALSDALAELRRSLR